MDSIKNTGETMLEVTCPYCRHAVTVEDDSLAKKVRCPNCSASFIANAADASLATAPAGVAPGSVTPGMASKDSVSLASLISSLVVCIPIVPQVVGIILGIIGLVRPLPSETRRSGMATVGIVISLIALVCWSGFIRAVWTPITTTVNTPVAGPGYWRSSPYVDVDEEQFQRNMDMAETLTALSHALDGYVIDFGAWPSDLEVMIPSYLDRQTAESIRLEGQQRPDALVILVMGIDPSMAEPETIIAYSEETLVNTSGVAIETPHRWILHSDGKLKFEPGEAIERSGSPVDE